jgi:hypothetical protein
VEINGVGRPVHKFYVAGNFKWRRRLQRREETNHAKNRQVRQERQEFGFLILGVLGALGGNPKRQERGRTSAFHQRAG